MALHNEIEFERDICHHLAAHGWLYAEGDAKGYDTPRRSSRPTCWRGCKPPSPKHGTP